MTNTPPSRDDPAVPSPHALGCPGTGEDPDALTLGSLALEEAPQALVIADPSGRVRLMNRRARRLLSVADTGSAADWPGRMPALRGSLGSGWHTLPVGHNASAPFWVWSRPLVQPGAIPSAAGGAGAAAGAAILHAVWPCRMSEEQAHAGGGDAAAFDEMMAVVSRHALLGEMGGALAHQMSQPLNIIRLTAERAALEAETAQTLDPATVGDRFARLADQAEALFETVSLLQGAPAIGGPSDLEPVDIGPLMKQAATLARGPLRAAGLRPDVVVPADMPQAWGEPLLLLQIGFAVLTVLAEALGGTSPGPASGPASGFGRRSRTAGPGAAGATAGLVVRVAPDVAGSPDRGRLIVDMIRDDMLASDPPLTPVPPDLTLSRRIVVAAMALAGLGGHLLMLVDDQGAQRGLRLDLARVCAGSGAGLAPRTAVASDRSPRPDEPADPAGGSVRVLVVEDEIEAAMEIAAYLREEDHIVALADTVDQALDALDSEQFDVLVTDLAMSGGGARRLMRAAEAAHPDMALILASGYAVEDDPACADLMDMADAVLRKPYGLGQLRDTIARVLGGDPLPRSRP